MTPTNNGSVPALQTVTLQTVVKIIKSETDQINGQEYHGEMFYKRPRNIKEREISIKFLYIGVQLSFFIHPQCMCHSPCEDFKSERSSVLWWSNTRRQRGRGRGQGLPCQETEGATSGAERDGAAPTQLPDQTGSTSLSGPGCKDCEVIPQSPIRNFRPLSPLRHAPALICCSIRVPANPALRCPIAPVPSGEWGDLT